ncbi:acyl-CoA dehydrogenase family protein [Micromonospora robiginosa]|uniref:Acyl-CoA dehydrogenase family protein n=1 Tax=Micromonospora robiginosa TaxID=2749844 RepID=A0A7L6BEJ0_9ACTN|nr:acyl-CoA dehydrogenase family protein [Micromonospora ferruginea]QLQ40373.2 acyl-CoA dehydrogenase family protein [Micromonospora ferruginea]
MTVGRPDPSPAADDEVGPGARTPAVTDGRHPAAAFRSAVRDGRLDLPAPGGGRTAERFRRLAALGRADLTLARLGEGHADALAILAELGASPDPARRREPWGVWAAVPASLTATWDGERWRLTGDRPWCSGAGLLSRALVTATAADGVRLFSVEVGGAGVTPLAGTWPAVGMAASDSRTVRFDDVPGTPVGGPGSYTARPGFWHGGTGVAACWYGGAVGVADTLHAAARRRPLGPHALAHLGAVDAALAAARAVLFAAADEIDADPTGDADRLAHQVRAAVEATATTVADRVGRALGAGPLCQDADHARRVADLTVYLRQSHAEADLAHLGELVTASGDPGW